MFKQIARAPDLTAALYGVIFAIVGTAFWGIYAISSPINDWLLARFILNGQPVVYYLSMYLHDLALNVLIALPFAILLSRVSPQNNWRYVWVALGTALVLQYWRLFADPVGLSIILKAWSFYAGFLASTVALPLAFLIVVKVRPAGNSAPKVL